MNVKELQFLIVAYSRHVQSDIGKDFRAPQLSIFNAFTLDVKQLIFRRLGHDMISSVSYNHLSPEFQLALTQA